MGPLALLRRNQSSKIIAQILQLSGTYPFQNCDGFNNLSHMPFCCLGAPRRATTDFAELKPSATQAKPRRIRAQRSQCVFQDFWVRDCSQPPKTVRSVLHAMSVGS
jgi:hypothetical protein